jgi:hypothetical protein
MIEVTNIEIKRVNDQTILQIEAGKDIFQMDLILPDDMLKQLEEQVRKPEPKGPIYSNRSLSATKNVKSSCIKCPGRSYPSGQAHFKQCLECEAKDRFSEMRDKKST